MKKRQLELTVQIFNSFEEAEEAQRKYWSPTQILVETFPVRTFETSKIYQRT